MLVHVTQEHIDCGQRNSCFWCPVANALLQSGVSCPSVWSDRVMYWPKDSALWVSSRISAATQRKIDYYDRTGKMEPFSFRFPLERSERREAKS